MLAKLKQTFNVRKNNYRKYSKKRGAILACAHFQNPNHTFQRDTKFIFIEQITKICNIIEKLMFKKDNIWILDLLTFYPDGLRQELNDI